MKLSIKETSWSGHTKDYKPHETEKICDININEKYIIKTINTTYTNDGKLINKEREVLSFDITEINDSSIKIHTYQPFSDSKNGTIDLNTIKQDFIISESEPIKLVTPTMDFGYIFIISLIK